MSDASDLPSSWTLAQLEEVAKWGSGGTPSRGNPKFYNGKIPWIKTGELGSKYVFRTGEHITEEAVKKSSAKLFPKGSVGIAMYGATIGKTSIFGIEASTNQACAVAICNDSIIHNEYLYYFLGSQQRSFVEAGKGGAQPNISQGVLKEWYIPYAPLNEQKRIVEKIEELFSELDNGIESLKAAREQLKIYRQSVLKHAFEGISSQLRLEQVSEAVGGFAFKSGDFKNEKCKFQVIRMGNVKPGQLRLSESPVFVSEVDEKILSRYLLMKDDVLITLTGTRNKRDYGFTAIVNQSDLLINQRLAYLRFAPNYSARFFLYFSWTEEFKQQFFGFETGNVGQGNVGMKSIRETLVPNLPFTQQLKICEYIEARFDEIVALEKEIELQIAKSETLRQSILKTAFSGKLVPQDPNDEPASVLLERIKADAAKSGGTEAKRRKSK
jgi:type I restriction enzyme, S subunit